jgi:Tfp pilus assembly protein PilF
LTAGDNHADALATFQQALEIEPEDILLLCNAATAAARAGQESIARQYLARAQARDARNPAVMAAAAILGGAR